MRPKRIYGTNAIEYDGDDPKLVVDLAGKKFRWPFQAIKAGASSAWIASASPLQGKNLKDSLVIELTQLLVPLRPTIVVAPYSSKSASCFKKAVRLVSKQLGKSIVFVSLLNTSQGSAQGCTTIYSSATSAGKIKVMGVAKKDVPRLKETYFEIRSPHLVFIDDAITTGSTLTAMQQVVQKALGKKDINPKIAVVVEEIRFDKKYSKKPSIKNLVAAIRTPILKKLP